MTKSAAIGLMLTAVFVTAIGAQQPPCDLFCHSRLAERAARAGNHAEEETHARAVAALIPSHPSVVYRLARLYMRRGVMDSAVATLERVAVLGDTRDLDADSAFARLRGDRGYERAKARLVANRRPILGGRVAFELSDPDFLPEALSYDSTRRRYLLGSLSQRRLASVAPNGQPSALIPFINSVPGMLRVVGIHIDQARNRLWFATWGPDSTVAPSDSTETPSLTRLFLADAATGRIIRSWTPDGGQPGHLLNDFVVMADGSLLITDTERGWIYRLRSPSDTLELFLRPDPVRFSSANGITVTPDGATLYVAYVEGLARIDVMSREVTMMPAPDSVSTASIDGLYWYRGTLIAVQGIPTMARVVMYGLSRDGRRIESARVLERGPGIVEDPTTGVIVGTRFYYIANSQYSRLTGAGALSPPSGAPRRTVIRVIDLQR